MRLLLLLSRYRRSQSGNALMIFCLAVPVLFGMAGLAVDFSRMHSAKLAAQSTLDAALLAAARNQGINDAGVNSLVVAYFNKPGARKHDSMLASLSGSLNGTTGLRGDANLMVPTTLLNVLGLRYFDVRIESRVSRGLGNVEIALVLDTTRSMEGTRLANVKTAASQLVDTIFALPDAANKVKVGLVPFSQYVNVGLANRNASWMDVPPDTTTTTTVCSDTYPDAVRSNCRMVSRTTYNDGVPSTSLVEECDWSWGTPVNVCAPSTSTLIWNGCAGARSSPLNIRDEQYSTRIPGIRNVSCPSQILPLSKSPVAIKSSIDAMVASGETYIPSGLVWGWRSLSNRAPFTESADDPITASGAVRKYLVLMTDGYNTKSPRWPEGDHEGSDAVFANQLTRDICDNIRADTESKIEIFTIAFEVADESVKDILRYCATPGGAFFDAVDYSRLLTAFGEIGSSVSVARVSQ